MIFWKLFFESKTCVTCGMMVLANQLTTVPTYHLVVCAKLDIGSTNKGKVKERMVGSTHDTQQNRVCSTNTNLRVSILLLPTLTNLEPHVLMYCLSLIFAISFVYHFHPFCVNISNDNGNERMNGNKNS